MASAVEDGLSPVAEQVALKTMAELAGPMTAAMYSLEAVGIHSQDLVDDPGYETYKGALSEMPAYCADQAAAAKAGAEEPATEG
ncbi:hypothetical protein D3C78_1633620 [compost metagenome]